MEPLVEISAGKLRGRREPPGVEVFRGIPYAASPTGPRRFRRPVPAEPWGGVLDASRFGPAPMQSVSSIYAGGLPGNRVADVSEDCLTVNVWTPGRSGSRPVMVWVFGGAYLTGGSAIGTYDGARLALEQDVVVVSFNYRMGALGFLLVEGGDSNCGLRDQLAALRWVRDNIAAFGGDPANVTGFGESAGAGSLLHLLACPDAAGLLDRAVLQSPGVDHTLVADQAGAVTRAVMEAAGADRPGRLWDMPPEAVLAAQEAALPGLVATVGSMPLHPVVDGDFLPGKPGTGFAAPGVDLLVSWTAEEMRLYPDPRADEGGRPLLARWLRRLITAGTGADPGESGTARLLDFYAPAGTGADIWAAIQTDCVMRLPARRVALRHAAAVAAAGSGRRTHVAQFDWGAEGGPWRRGAFHAIDLPFTFGTLDRAGWLEFLGAAGPDDRGAGRVARAHMQAWGAFARTGDPGWAGYPDEVLRFDADPAPGPDPLAAAARAWAGLWSDDGPVPA